MSRTCDALSSGFTLMEILVAVVIFSILMLTIFTSFQAFVAASRHIEAAVSGDEALGPSLAVITRDLSAIHVSLPPRYARPDTRSALDPFQVVGEESPSGGDRFSRLRFVTRGLLTALGKGATQMVQVIYYVRADDRGHMNLYRSETLPPWEAQAEKSCDPVVVRDIAAFEVTFRNGDDDIFSHWDSDAAAFDWATPRAVGIFIQLRADASSGASAMETASGSTVATTVVLPVFRGEEE